jgi:hypothetical protein
VWRVRVYVLSKFNISQSFRFGAEIATLANIVLYTMKRERKAVFGMGKPSSIFIRPGIFPPFYLVPLSTTSPLFVTNYADDAPAKRTIICRSNLGVLLI